MAEDAARQWVEERARLHARICELETQLATQRRTETELRSDVHELRDFIENAKVGLHRVGPDGRILWANQAELDLLGYSRNEYIGHQIAEFHVDRAVIDDLMTRLFRDEVLQDREARLRAKDGTIRHVVITSNVRWIEDKFVHTRCFTRDVTDRKRAERRLSAQYAVASILSENRDVSEATPGILRAVCTELELGVGALWYPDESINALRCINVWQDGEAALGHFVEETRRKIFQAGEGLPGRVWTAGAPAWIETLTADSNFPRAPVAAATGLHTGMAFPILNAGVVLGVMEFFSTDRRPPDAPLLDAMAALGRQIGQFIRRQQAERELKVRVDELQKATEELTALRRHQQ